MTKSYADLFGSFYVQNTLGIIWLWSLTGYQEEILGSHMASVLSDNNKSS